MSIRFTCFAAALWLLFGAPLAGEGREWTDRTGRYRVEAELVHVRDGVDSTGFLRIDTRSRGEQGTVFVNLIRLRRNSGEAWSEQMKEQAIAVPANAKETIALAWRVPDKLKGPFRVQFDKSPPVSVPDKEVALELYSNWAR